MVAALSLKEKNQDTINQAINQLQQGRDNASGIVTLAVSPATTTTVVSPVCSPTSGVQLTPMTADAAAALTATYVSATSKGQFTIAHANSAQVDRTFFYRVHGGS
jgi:hypothetical protein